MSVQAMSVVVGLDVGGTKTNATVLTDDGRFLVDHMVEVPPSLGQEEIKRFSLCNCPREAVEDRAGTGRCIEPLTDQRADDGIADELAALHHGLGFETNRAT